MVEKGGEGEGEMGVNCTTAVGLEGRWAGLVQGREGGREGPVGERRGKEKE